MLRILKPALRQGGGALVELAFVMPLLVFLIVATFELAMFVYLHLSLSSITYEVSRRVSSDIAAARCICAHNSMQMMECPGLSEPAEVVCATTHGHARDWAQRLLSKVRPGERLFDNIDIITAKGNYAQLHDAEIIRTGFQDFFEAQRGMVAVQISGEYTGLFEIMRFPIRVTSVMPLLTREEI